MWDQILLNSTEQKLSYRKQNRTRSFSIIAGMQYLQRTKYYFTMEIFKIAEMTFNVTQDHW